MQPTAASPFVPVLEASTPNRFVVWALHSWWAVAFAVAADSVHCSANGRAATMDCLPRSAAASVSPAIEHSTVAIFAGAAIFDEIAVTFAAIVAGMVLDTVNSLKLKKKNHILDQI